MALPNTNNYFTQAQQDWLIARLGKITASNAHKLFKAGRGKSQMFGDGAMTYIYELVDEMTTGVPKEENDYKQTEWGKANEMDAIFSFESITGLHVEYHGISNPVFVPHGDFAGGSPDGEVIEAIEDALTECKCHYDGSKHMRKLAIKSVEEFKDIFWEEYCQDQLNMRASKKTNCYSISYDPRKKIPSLKTKIIKVPYDIEWQKEFDTRHDAALEIIAGMIDNMDKYLIVGK